MVETKIGKGEDLDVVAEAQVKRSESKEKVASALSNIFREAGELRIEENLVQFASGRIESLQFIKEQLRDRRVRAAAKRLLLSNRGDSESNQTYLLLNKQAATVKIVALCDDPRESPLGPIVLRIRSQKNLSYIIDWLTVGYEGGVQDRVDKGKLLQEFEDAGGTSKIIPS